MEEPPHCQWHNEIQSKIQEVNYLVYNHTKQKLNQEQLQKNDDWVKRFVWYKGKKSKMWTQIEKFYCKPSVFKIKDIQLHIEDDFRRRNPDISEKELEEKVRDLSTKIENQIREDFTQKYSDLSKKEINKKVREVNVKGYLTGDREKYVSDKAKFLVGDAIHNIMFDKPGLM